MTPYDEKQLIHSKSYDWYNTDEIINDLFHSLLHRYQIGLEVSVKGFDFAFDHSNGLHYK